MHHDTRFKQIVELGLPPVQLAVLLSLNRFANHKTHECHPSLATIARVAVVHWTTALRAIKALADRGHIQVRSRAKTRTSNIYIVLPRALQTATTSRKQYVRKARGTNYLPPGYVQALFSSLNAAPSNQCSHCGTRPAVADGLCGPCIKSPYRKQVRQ